VGGRPGGIFHGLRPRRLAWFLHWSASRPGRGRGARRSRSFAFQLLLGVFGSVLPRPSFLSLPSFLREFIRWRDPGWGHCRMGSLTGAVHLSNDNAGVLRLAQGGQKPPVEQKGKCRLDPDFQYEYGPRKRGLSILLAILSLKQEVSEKLPQG